MSQQILTRIAIGNYLLSTAGSLTPSADALSVAQTILLTHDASELILSALAASTGATFKDKHKTFMMDYVNALEEKKHIGIKLFFNELNEARIGFKHLGIPPNASHFYDCTAKARQYLDDACVTFLGQTLEEVGLEALIEDDLARDLYTQSKKLRQERKLREALELIGRAFRQSLNATPFMYIVIVGDPDTEAALHLLGCGVDPSMFISLQRLLPTVDFGGAVTWNTRDRGHPANWTQENVDYCLAAVLKIILQIQHAPFAAWAAPFQVAFEDVLTAKRDGVLLHGERGGFYRLFRSREPRKIVGELEEGQQIWGHVTPAFEYDYQGKWEETTLENANIFVLSQPKGDSLKNLETDTEIIVRTDLVDLSYRVKDNSDVRERFPHLFE